LGADLGISTDIRGFARTFPNPDMGAFESASAPNVDLGDDISACGSVLINGIIPGADSYSWNVGGNLPSLLITQSGTYILTATNEIGSDSDTLNIEILPIPTVNAGSNQQVCAGEEIQLNGSGTGNCAWLSSNGTELANTCDASIVLSSSGNITLKSTTANGCEAFDTLTVTVDALPEVPVITVDGAYLVASADGELQWYQDNQPIDGETGDSLAIPGSGNFAVEVTNAAGCSVFSVAVDVNVTGSASLLVNSIHVFPNPFNQTFSIIGAELTGKNFNIIDQVGSIVLKGKFESDNQQIDMDCFLPGFYSIIIPERNPLRLIKIN
jgi:hypothetical protein